MAVEHAIRVAEALEAAHQSGLIHRDIKPENILLTESGHPKVADFGIARAASATSRSGLHLGTPHYISPEQAEGEPATFRSDLYSLGIVFYEMLTGKLPYEAEHAWGILSQHIRGQLRPLKEVNPDVPEGIGQVCVRLLARDPNQRYPDAATLMEDLKRVKDNPNAVMDDMGPTVPLGRVRGDTGPTLALGGVRGDMVPTTVPTGQSLSWADQLAELYAQARRLLTGPPTSLEDQLAELYARARRLHRAQEWQAVVDVFYQIDALDPAYPDPKGLLVSAREELAVLKLARIYGQGRQHMVAKEWRQALECFEEIQQLKPGYQETEKLLSRAQQKLAVQELERKVASTYDQGHQHMNAEEWRQALECFRQVQRLKPGYQETENRLSQLQQKLTEAQQERAAQELMRKVTPIYDQGHQHMEAEEWQQALECFEEIERLKPGYPETQRLLSLVRHELMVGITPSNVDRIQRLRTIGKRGEQELGRETLPGLAEGYTDWVRSVAFSPDGRLLASGTDDNTVQLWWVEDGTLLRALEGHTDRVFSSMAFSPDGLLASGAGRTVRLWGVEDGALQRTLEEHTSSVNSVAFSPDGLLLASGASDKTIRLWGMA